VTQTVVLVCGEPTQDSFHGSGYPLRSPNYRIRYTEEEGDMSERVGAFGGRLGAWTDCSPKSLVTLVLAGASS